MCHDIFLVLYISINNCEEKMEGTSAKFELS